MTVTRDTLTTILALLISGVWATVTIADIFISNYTAIEVVTPVMLIVAGFLFGVRVSKNGNGNGNGK